MSQKADGSGFGGFLEIKPYFCTLRCTKRAGKCGGFEGSLELKPCCCAFEVLENVAVLENMY